MGGRGKAIVIVVLLFVALAASAYLIGLPNRFEPRYVCDIERSSSTPEEEEAIARAEALDLPPLVNCSRYNLWSRATNTTPEDPDEWVWPALIDAESLRYYQGRVAHLRREEAVVRVSMGYEALCRLETDLTFRCDASNGYIYLDVDDPWDEGRWDHGETYTYSNVTGLEGEKGTHTLELAYVVWQDLSYSEYYGPLAAKWAYSHQVIVLDGSYNVRAVIANVGHYKMS